MNRMRVIFVVSLLCIAAAAQTSPPAPKKSTPKPAGKESASPMPAATKPTAVIDTTAGRMTCTLFPNKSPNSVANFVGLATGAKEWKDPKTSKTMRNKPLYDGTIFHRVIPNFMVQGGDPLGNGTGGPGFEMAYEFPDVKFEVAGRLAYANSGANTNGSQFFITEVPAPHLDAPNHYTIFGTCDEATVELVKQIARRPRDERNDRPFDPVVINKITILGYKLPAASAPATKKPAKRAPAKSSKPTT